MNMIICNEKCRHQKDGYCALTGMAQITNALASPCCYFEETPSRLPPAAGGGGDPLNGGSAV
jgi:hypothetical protein